MYSKEYYKENKEYFKSKHKEYISTIKGRAHIIYAGLRGADKNKGFPEPNITAEQISELIQQPCHWCGQTDWSKNGIDRLDNSRGHNIDNVVCSCCECNHKRGIEYLMRPIKEYDIEGNFIKRYQNVYEAAKLKGVKTPSIYNSCNGKYNRKSSCGSLWCYEGEENTILEKVEAYTKRQHQKTKIRQLTIDGLFVAEYDSMHEAERITGFSHSGISMCCNGQKETFCNYKWERI